MSSNLQSLAAAALPLAPSNLLYTTVANVSKKTTVQDLVDVAVDQVATGPLAVLAATVAGIGRVIPVGDVALVLDPVLHHLAVLYFEDTCIVSVPETLPVGFNCSGVQGSGNNVLGVVQIAPSGAAIVGNIDGFDYTAGLYAPFQLAVVSNAGGNLAVAVLTGALQASP